MAKLNTQTSVVDYLKSQGKNSSYSARKKMAEEMGITGYKGSEAQNIQLMKALQKGETANNPATETAVTNVQPEAPKQNDVATPAEVQAEAVVTPTAEERKDNTLNGVSDELMSKTESEFEVSDDWKERDKVTGDALSNLGNLTSKEDIVSQDVWDALGSDFKVPGAVLEADAYLKEQLQKIQSGKTSYSDQVKDMMDKIMNREKFSYDVDKDPLFQQALASSMNAGKTAMQDTIGQASALTGGYGSTYATSAGNQAYNSFIEDAYNNLPQYYQMAMEAYQMEGDEMYRQFGMLSELDDKEFNRNVTAYDATYQHRNRVYDEAYNMYRDTKNDAFNMANLQINEHGQRVSDAYNFYSASSNYADSLYAREFDKWNAEVNNAMQMAGIYNNDWWNQTNFDEGVRQYEQSFAEDVRQFNENLAHDDKWKQMSYDQTEKWNQMGYDQTEKWNQAEMDYKYTALNKSGGSGGSGGGYKLSTTEINGLNEAFNNGGVDGAMAYLIGIGKEPADDYSLSVVENLLYQAETKATNDKNANTPKSGTISDFRSKKGDNFTVKVGNATYGVENHGKVTDSTTLKDLNKLNTSNATTFLYNGEAYAKSGDGYYLIGAKMFGGKDYEELKKALQK